MKIVQRSVKGNRAKVRLQTRFRWFISLSFNRINYIHVVRILDLRGVNVNTQTASDFKHGANSFIKLFLCVFIFVLGVPRPSFYNVFISILILLYYLPFSLCEISEELSILNRLKYTWVNEDTKEPLVLQPPFSIVSLRKSSTQTLSRISCRLSVKPGVNRFFVFRCWKTVGFSDSCGIYRNGRSRRARRYITAASPSFSAQLLLASFCTRQLSIDASARICSTLTDFSRVCQCDARHSVDCKQDWPSDKGEPLCRWLCFPQPFFIYELHRYIPQTLDYSIPYYNRVSLSRKF